MRTSLRILLITSLLIGYSLAECPVNCSTCSLDRCTKCEVGFAIGVTGVDSGKCLKCQILGCGECKPISLGSCDKCRSGYYSPGSIIPSSSCQPCTSNCEVCDNSDTCSICNFISTKSKEGKCDLNKKKLALILGLAIGIPVLLFIICCIFCYKRNHSKKERQKILKEQ